jgi:hypothetical protein
MSLSANKSALFGKTPSTTASTAKPTTASKPPPASVAAAPVISSAVKAKKIEEAREWSQKGMEYLKKTVFKWNPDHMAAAPCFEKASNSYKVLLLHDLRLSLKFYLTQTLFLKIAGELELSREMMVKSAQSNESAGILSAAALCYFKAADIAKSENRSDLSSNLLEQASEMYGVFGDLDKSAEMLAKAAKEVCGEIIGSAARGH